MKDKKEYYDDTNPEEENGIITSNKFSIKNSDDRRFIVIDNFYEDPEAIREFALQQMYFDGEGAVGCRTRKQFLFEGVKEKFEEALNYKISDHTENGYGWKDQGINGRFQSCKGGTPQVFHCDSQRWAGVLYLTPNAPVQSGTSFYQHKEEKIFHNSQIDWDNGQGERVFNQNTFVDPTPYERIDTVGNVFNRLVLFDGGLIHSGNDYFGWDIPSSRLFQIFFFE